jgi:hypothetical protein
MIRVWRTERSGVGKPLVCVSLAQFSLRHSGIEDNSRRSCRTALGTVKPVGPTLTQDQRPSLTTGTPALAMLSTKSPAR